MAATTNSTDTQNPAPQDFPLALFERFPALIWRADPYASRTYFNRTWLEFTGRTLEQELGDGWTARIHPEDFDRCVSAYLGHFAVQTPLEMEYRLRPTTGNTAGSSMPDARPTMNQVSSPGSSASAWTSPTGATPRPNCANGKRT